MDIRMTVSSKVQVVIPKFLRNMLGLHSGSELIVHLRQDKVLELQPVQRNIREFFGKGAHRIKGKKMSLADIDTAIAQAVTDNDRR